MPTFKAVLLTGKNQTRADGTANVKIRVTHNRKVAYIATDIYIAATDFDNRTGLATRGPNAAHINVVITEKLLAARKTALGIGDFGNI